MSSGAFLLQNEEGVEYRLWNVGKGPGIVSDIELYLEGAQVLRPLKAQMAVAAEGARDDSSDLSVPWTLRWGDGAGVEGELLVYYRHASGNRYVTRSRVRGQGTFIYSVDFRRDSAAEGEDRPLRTPADR